MNINNLYNEIKEKVLSFDEVLNIGINNEDLEWDVINWIALDPRVANPPQNPTKFTGLAYALDNDNNIEGYTEYKNGLEDGLEVEFYSNGNIQSYYNMVQRNAIGLHCQFDKNKECILAEMCSQDGKRELLYKKETL